jgi:dihydropteroate synthase
VSTLRLRERTVDVQAGRPLIMGIVNAGDDSFSDAVRLDTLERQVQRGLELVAEGADLVDVGAESGVTYTPVAAAGDEASRVVPLVERLASEGVSVSVDTWKPEVARAALEAGAVMLNDVSGLRDPALADVCAETGAALVLMHTRAAPKHKLLDPALDGRVAADVAAFLAERMELARERGVAAEQLILDPGPDFGKTPAQTVESLRALDEVHALGRPVLLALSRKDFIGAIVGRPPRERLAGTLAAVGWGVEAGGHVLRLHDVAAAADFLAVRAVLAGERELDAGARLAEDLRRERA